MITDRLADVADVSTGASFRTRLYWSQGGNCKVIQMSDLGDDNLVNLNFCMQIDLVRLNPDQLVKRGDLIFRSRGQTTTAALLDNETENTIVAAPLFRIRPKPDKVVPEFLHWWINQPFSQGHFHSRSMGTMLKMVRMRDLEELEVTYPSLEQQQKIIEFLSLSMEEQRILEEIKYRKSKIARGIVMKMVSEPTRN